MCAPSRARGSRRQPVSWSRSSRRSATTIPPDQLDNIVDNIGLPFSGINMAYQNTGTIGPEDGDVLISLKEDHDPTAGYVKRAAHRPAAEVSGHDLLLPARRHRLADPEFRPAGADRRAGHRQQPEGQLRLCQRPAQAHPPGARHRGPAHPAGLQLSADQCRCRPDAGRRGRADPARRRQQPARHAVGQRPGAAQFLAQYRKRRVLSDRRPDAAIPGQQHLGPVQHPDHGPGNQSHSNIWAGLHASPRGRAPASSPTTTCSR